MKQTLLYLLILISITTSAFSQQTNWTKTIMHDYETQYVRVNLTSKLKQLPGIGIRLVQDEDLVYASQGTLRSWADRAPLLFNNLILSWNLDLPEGTGARIEVRARDLQFNETSWYEMARIGKVPYQADVCKKDNWGEIKQDTLVLNKLWTEAQYRVTLYSTIPHRSPTLRLMSICYANLQARKAPILTTEKSAQPWKRSLPVRWRSQGWEEKSISGRICGPTSLSMALDYWGRDLPTADVATQAWDDANHLFGNWPFLAQAAARNGLKSWVMRCEDYAPIHDEIAAGNPTILSIAFTDGELNNAPFSASRGHLILCVGFTSKGDLICNDPGSLSSRFSHRVYKKEEMAKAWLDRGGVAIVIRPRHSN